MGSFICHEMACALCVFSVCPPFQSSVLVHFRGRRSVLHINDLNIKFEFYVLPSSLNRNAPWTKLCIISYLFKDRLLLVGFSPMKNNHQRKLQHWWESSTLIINDYFKNKSLWITLIAIITFYKNKPFVIKTLENIYLVLSTVVNKKKGYANIASVHKMVVFFYSNMVR